MRSETEGNCRTLILGAILLVCGCGGSGGGERDGDADGDADGDVDGDVDGDGDMDVVSDPEMDPELDTRTDSDHDPGFVGTVYFVASDGNDENDGLAGTPDHAWQTIARVNAQDLEPGDAVLFRSGDEWREELVIGASGSAEAYITYGAYGEGNRPRILGSNQAGEWTAVDGHANVWRSGTVLAAPREREGNPVTNHPASIFFGETGGGITWGNMESIHLNGEGAPTDIYACDEQGEPFSLLDREYDWCWQDDHIYVYAPASPADRYAFVEVPQRVAAIRTADHPPEQYIAIDGLELMYALKYGYDDGWPMNVVVRGLTIRNCHIGYMGTKGAASAIGLQIWHSDMLVQQNDIHDCGRRAISYNVYGDVRDAALVFENVVFEGNTLHNGYHTTGFDISCGYTDTFRNFVFRNNFIWDDPADDPQDSPNDFTSMGMFLDAGDAAFTGFQVHHNILKYTKQKGITINGLTDSHVFNNTLYGMNERAGGDYRGMINVSGDVENLRIENNIFYGQVDPAQLVLSCVTFSGTSDAGTSMNHNLYFQEHASQKIVTINSSGSSYEMADWADYLGDTGWDADSPAPQDPLLADPAGDDFSLLPGSPAIDAGVLIEGGNDDYTGGAPDIGAVESL